jgi:hypothetical protein
MSALDFCAAEKQKLVRGRNACITGDDYRRVATAWGFKIIVHRSWTDYMQPGSEGRQTCYEWLGPSPGTAASMQYKALLADL